MIFYSLGPKLSEYEQAIARVNRPGQKAAPRVYVMMPEGPNGEPSIARRVFAALRDRRNMLDTLLGKGMK